MRSLCRRVVALERKSIAAIEADGRIKWRYAYKRVLPRDYVGERHEVLVRGWPSETVAGHEDCLVEERPGPGPKLEFGFRERTHLLYFVRAPVPLEDDRIIMPPTAGPDPLESAGA
jgi:hypothetical protein